MNDCLIPKEAIEKECEVLVYKHFFFIAEKQVVNGCACTGILRLPSVEIIKCA